MDLTSYLSLYSIKPSDFAERIGITATALQRYLDGDRRPRAPILERIHQATDGQVQPNDFFSFIKEPAPI